MRGQAQRLFLRWGRPLAPAATFVVYAIVALVRPESPASGILLPLGVSVGAGLGYAALLPRLGPVRVLRLVVVVDTLLIAWMTVALGRPDVYAIAYFWSIAIAGVLLGGRETLAATAVAAVAAGAVPYLARYDADGVVVLTNVVVLLLVGGILAFAAGDARRSERRLLEESALNAVALRIADAVRSSLEVDDVLARTVAELGPATRSARALCKLLGGDAALHQWVRPGVARVEVSGVPATVAAVVRAGRPLVVESRDVAPPDVLDYLRQFGTHAFIGYPVVWRDEVIAVFGLHHDRPRRWGQELDLLHRTIPQVAAALAQAAAFERERQLAQMREELITNVSHELRTPLTSTLGFLQTLERADVALPSERRHAYLRIAREQAERLALLVEDLLLLAKLDRDLPLDRAAVRVRDVVEEAARPLELDRRELRIEVPPEAVVDGDRHRLLQVFSNLLSNARQHGRGDISVEGRVVDSTVRVAVRDEGPPLPPEAREAIFLPFARWSGNTEGTGLGLPISRAITEAHGGTLVYEDGAFVLTLPAPSSAAS